MCADELAANAAGNMSQRYTPQPQMIMGGAQPQMIGGPSVAGGGGTPQQQRRNYGAPMPGVTGGRQFERLQQARWCW
jgi:hypothetical protein